ncbi:MAG: hypothetical protein LC721_08215, partial [Actinobacteria bacterium]|nr:hypothetical protein [Actinomycetota bacterium]
HHAGDPCLDRPPHKRAARRFAGHVRAWLLVLLDGDARARARSHCSLYVYYGAVRPLLQDWAASRGHLRETTAGDVTAALEPLRGWSRRTTIAALRSLIGFATKRRLVFTNPTTRLKAEDIDRVLMPITEDKIRAVEQIAVHPAQRLIIALLAVHAARRLDPVPRPGRCRPAQPANHPGRASTTTRRDALSDAAAGSIIVARPGRTPRTGTS